MRLPVYLDYAATTPVDPAVAAEMAKAIDANALFRANSQALQIITSVNQLAVNNLMKV